MLSVVFEASERERVAGEKATRGKMKERCEMVRLEVEELVQLSRRWE